MIVLDTSSLIAILLKEPDADLYLDRLLGEPDLKISAVNAYETGVVLAMRQGPVAVDDFWRLLARAGVQIEPFGDEQIRTALAAYVVEMVFTPEPNSTSAIAQPTSWRERFDAPLPFKGEDFPHTDVARYV